jgi:hypothetical protein
MVQRQKRVKAPEPVEPPESLREIAKAIREVCEQIRESFGPRLEVRQVGSFEVRGTAELLDQVRELKLEPADAERFGGHGELIGREDLEPTGTPREERALQLKQEIRDRVLQLCGWEDGGEVTADGSADNDLAQERADEIMALVDFVRGSGYPGIVAPMFAPASVEQVKQSIRHLLLKITKNDDDPKPTRGQLERTDVIEAFISLARTHPDPRRLLPRGDRTGDWLPPGTRVTVLGQHPGVVEPELDMVRVKLDAVPTATSFPRNSIVKEGEEWTPPKPTA